MGAHPAPSRDTHCAAGIVRALTEGSCAAPRAEVVWQMISEHNNNQSSTSATVYYLYLVVLGIEYSGIGYNVIPALRTLSVTLILSAILLLYVLFRHNVREILSYRQSVWLLVFIGLTALALTHGFVRSYAIEPLKQQIGYLILCIAGIFIIDTERRIYGLARMFVLIYLYLIIINLDKLISGVRRGAFTASYFMGDGNDFAWGVNATLGFALYLVYRSETKLIRWGGGLMFALYIFAILGTQSRGASLALAGSILYLWLIVSRKKIRMLLALAMVGVFALAFTPEGYFTRMQTISTYEEDSSAMARIKAWGHALDMAVDNPVLGVGAGSFNSAYGRLYRQAGDPVRWISTHSIYFKVLAEYGFVGLWIFLLIIWNNFRSNWQLRSLIKSHAAQTQVPVYWPDLLNICLIGYAVSAMFLSGVNYPHIYLLTALSISAYRIYRRDIEHFSGMTMTVDGGVDTIVPVRDKWPYRANDHA